MSKNIKKVQNMKRLIKNTVLYLNYLRINCGLEVSLHLSQVTFETLSEEVINAVIPFNCHTNPYCIKVKSVGYKKCLSEQQKIMSICREDSFCSNCHAGVYQYIYPLIKNFANAGFIAVSGYKKRECEGTLDADLWENALQDTLPKALCDAVIPPLAKMLEELFSVGTTANLTEYNRIVQFLNEYHTNVSLSDVARLINRSNSYVSHLFRSKSKMTLRAYCNGLKLQDAKKLIAETDLSVTEIALNVGFNDTSHFIALFKEKFGVTPLSFRKKYSI